MVLQLACATMALVLNAPMRGGTRTASPKMMPQFLKDLGLEKPDFSAISNPFAAAPPTPIEVKEPALPIVTAGKGMPLLGPIFNIEADLQALALNLGSYDEEAIQAEIT